MILNDYFFKAEILIQISWTLLKKKMTNTSSEHKLNLEWKTKQNKTKLFCLMGSGGEDKEKPVKFAKAFMFLWFSI